LSPSSYRIHESTYHDPAACAVLHTRARQQMGEAAYRAVVAEGRALSADEAVDLARAAASTPATRARIARAYRILGTSFLRIL